MRSTGGGGWAAGAIGARRAEAEPVEGGVEVAAERRPSRRPPPAAARGRRASSPAGSWSTGRGRGAAAGARCGAGPRSRRRPGRRRNRPGRRDRVGAPGQAGGSGRPGCPDRPAARGGRRGVKSSRRLSRAGAGSTASPAAVRPRARRGPCGGGRRGWRGRRGCACAAGTRGSSPGGGCWAGRCACSRAGSKTAVGGGIPEPDGPGTVTRVQARPAAGVRRTDSRPANGTERRPAGSNGASRAWPSSGCGRCVGRCTVPVPPASPTGSPQVRTGTRRERSRIAPRTRHTVRGRQIHSLWTAMWTSGPMSRVERRGHGEERARAGGYDGRPRVPVGPRDRRPGRQHA